MTTEAKPSADEALLIRHQLPHGYTAAEKCDKAKKAFFRG